MNLVLNLDNNVSRQRSLAFNVFLSIHSHTSHMDAEADFCFSKTVFFSVLFFPLVSLEVYCHDHALRDTGTMPFMVGFGRALTFFMRCEIFLCYCT